MFTRSPCKKIFYSGYICKTFALLFKVCKYVQKHLQPFCHRFSVFFSNGCFFNIKTLSAGAVPSQYLLAFLISKLKQEVVVY